MRIFISQSLQKIYFYNLRNKSFISKDYYKDYNPIYLQNFSIYYISNNNYFYNIYKNKILEDKKFNYKNKKIDVEFISIIYYIITSKIEDLLVY